MIASLTLAVVAGCLSVLSPCVLPLLPIVLGAAAAQSRWGPAALAGGLALSFVAIGLFFATVGFTLGFDADALRDVAAAVLIVIGLVLASPRLQARLAVAVGPVSGWIDRRFGARPRVGASGQFTLGLLLGAVWSPCVGPTLGAASVLAAQGRDLGQVALTMTAFGLGAALPLSLLGQLSRGGTLRWRRRMLAAATGLKAVLGLSLVIAGLSILSGLDRRAEAVLVDASPAWLTSFTTRF